VVSFFGRVSTCSRKRDLDFTPQGKCGRPGNGGIFFRDLSAIISHRYPVRERSEIYNDKEVPSLVRHSRSLGNEHKNAAYGRTTYKKGNLVLIKINAYVTFSHAVEPKILGKLSLI